MPVTRRAALAAALFTPATLAARPAAPAAARPAWKLSLAAYSFRKYLDLKSKTPDRMDYFQFADYCADLGLGAIEVTSYYVPDSSPAWLTKFKRHLTRAGLDVSGVAIGTDFCQQDAGKRAAEVAKAKDWLAIAGYLGGKTLRVFGGNVPKGDTEEATRARCVACIRELGDTAARHGVLVGVENHGGITATSQQLLAIIDAVDHEWVGINLDSGNFRTEQPYDDLARCAGRAVVVQMKTDIAPKGKPKSEMDFARVAGILRDAKYRGYLTLEYEGAEEPKTAVPKYLDVLRTWAR